MRIARVLVIAPGGDLRSSICFALEAEGYAVLSVGSADVLVGGEVFECTVLDHHALGKRDLRTFCREHAPVVYLANAALGDNDCGCFRTIVKPQLGGALLDAVRLAISAGKS